MGNNLSANTPSYKQLEEQKFRIASDLYLCLIIKQEHKHIKDELDIILHQKDEYKCNEASQKIIKHFPATTNMTYEMYKTKINKDIRKNRTISFSISSKSLDEQRKFIYSTAERRYNNTNLVPEDAYFSLLKLQEQMYPNKILGIPINERHNLLKYSKKEDIQNKYPGFFDESGRAFYDTIYAIKTENIHYYINANERSLCDTILVCCNGKIFNLMFELDADVCERYYGDIPYGPINEILIRQMFEDKNI
jgi:hypothetical protein